MTRRASLAGLAALAAGLGIAAMPGESYSAAAVSTKKETTAQRIASARKVCKRFNKSKRKREVCIKRATKRAINPPKCEGCRSRQEIQQKKNCSRPQSSFTPSLAGEYRKYRNRKDRSPNVARSRTRRPCVYPSSALTANT
jgi:hypothetical protein